MKRVLTAGLAVMLAAALTPLFGAGTADQGAGEAVPLRFLTAGDSAAPWIAGEQNDRIFQEINRRLGIKLKVEAYKQAEYEKVNVAVASGDIPDVVVNEYPSAAVYQWIDDGVLRPLDDYFKLMPAVKEQCDKESWTRRNGKFYGYPFITQKGTSNWNLVIRGDWLDKVGRKWPDTLDDFYATARDFVAKDPDGDGKADTFAFTERKEFDWAFVFFAYGLPHGDYNLDKSGKVMPWFEHPAWMEGMRFLRRMWAEGLIEPEYVLNDRQMMEDKFYHGRAGMMYSALFRHVSRIRANLAKVDPKGVMAFGDPPKGPTGKRGGQVQNKRGIYTSITTAAKRPDKAAMLIEFLVKDGRELLQLGTEGVHFTRQGDKIIYNEEERAKDNFAGAGWAHPLAWGHVWWPLEYRYLPLTEPSREDALLSVEVASRNQVVNLIPLTPDKEVELGAILTDIYSEYFVNILTGKLPLESGAAELFAKWRGQGGAQVLAEAQKVYEQYK
jgi:ABC-type glycerol-3-phosphate transport system substrate-binding protein